PVAEMLDAVTVVSAGRGCDGFLDRVERHVHGAVADRVDADAVSGAVIHIDRRIELFGRNADKTAMARIGLIGLVERGGAAGNTAVYRHLHAPNLQPVITEPGLEPEIEQALRHNLRLYDAKEQTNADREAAIEGKLLIGSNRFVVGDDVMDRGDAAAHRPACRMNDTLLHLFIRVGGNDIAHEVLRAFDEFAGQLTGRWIELDGASVRRRRLLGDVSERQRCAVRDGDMRPEADRNRMVRRCVVELLAAR